MLLLQLSGQPSDLFFLQLDVRFLFFVLFVRFYGMAFIASISSSQLFVPIVMTGMTTVLDDSTLVSDWKACLSDDKEESLL